MNAYHNNPPNTMQLGERSKNCPIFLGVGVGGYEEVWYEYCRKSKETPGRQEKCPWIFHRGPDRMASCSSMRTSGTIDALWTLRIGIVQRR
ncbi:uncharacterized protein Bfra_000955 [Botrytis fragariae]|uniref:Uncharacterized protein n=1 Tax=Botrytis fragariae TaxID=1964551 RepID=A0A8H6B3H8_9HELO|nr:uncharacterized protein Bfra_000955 [Botrytis fragariae]KAF5878786.1 hypothetical protein Bfra_000955 [Botrytis fragariae]